ncbi:MAG: cobalt ECF transporter T component CbiQ [Promethearchaeota archaeon]
MGKFIDKTLSEVLLYVKESMFAEEYARVDGFLQRLNTKAKFVGLMVFLLATVWTQKLEFILLAFAVSLVFAWRSKISAGHYLRRVIFVPLFTAVVAVPYIFNVFQPTDGTPLLVIHDFGRVVDLPLLRPFTRLTITREGVTWALTWMARILTAVTFSVLLVMTTPWSELLQSLREMKLPKTFVLILGMTYRYIFLLLDSVSKMLMSRKSRTVGKVRFPQSWRLNSHVVGALFIKSYELSNNVYMAMTSRGFDGTFRHLPGEATKSWKSAAFVGCGVLFFVLAIL